MLVRPLRMSLEDLDHIMSSLCPLMSAAVSFKCKKLYTLNWYVINMETYNLRMIGQDNFRMIGQHSFLNPFPP